MNIRMRAILVIVLTNVVIILFSVFVGIYYVQKSIDISQQTDLTVMLQITDHFLSSELDKLKLKSSNIVEILRTADESSWTNVLSKQNILYSEFIGMAVFDSGTGLIASSGTAPAGIDIMKNEDVAKAFRGQKPITSTINTDNGVVFYHATPLTFSNNRILVVTLPWNFFSRLLAPFVIWETGHVYMSDAHGYAISNPRDHWIQNRFNYIKAAEMDRDFIMLAKNVTRMTNLETGIGHYTIYGVPRVCSFRPVSASLEGWSLGVVAPLNESPVKNIDIGLLIVAFISILLSIIAAVIASVFIKKPFVEIAFLKEVAENANKAKSSFLSTMSHEIRTPMNAILGICEIQLQKEKVNTETREAMEKIYSSGDLLLSIINDILDLSKIEADKLELINDKYEIASMISDAAQLNMMRIGSKLIEFELCIDENTPARMIGDELRIKQVLNNLLSNAFKYTSSGAVKLSINADEGKNEDEVILQIIVSDSGQGMTKDQVAKLFDEYSRFNLEKNRYEEGTGLGMNITHKLINMMNGTIQVESEVDKGSVFTVRLTQKRCDTEVLGKSVAENLQQFRTHSRAFMHKVQISREYMPYGNVLVVDDVEVNLYVAKGLLAPYHVKASFIYSGIEAIEKVKSGNVYDIIFMDHMMPEMDGIEAVKHIREAGYTAPIVALTANAVSGQADMFLHSGFDDFISKPIDIRQLNTILNKYVRDIQPQEVIDDARSRMTENVHHVESEVLSQNDILLKQIMNYKIDELDITAGLHRFENNVEFYLKVLNAYVVSVRASLDYMKNFSDENIYNYRIKVHGVKGTSYDISARKIGDAAALLEKAASDNDTGYIRENNEPFLKILLEMIEKIEAMLGQMNAVKVKPEKDQIDSNVLLKLLEACNSYNMDDADAAMEEIEKFQYKSGDDFVKWLRDNIDVVNFEEVAEKINAMNLKKEE